MAVNHGEDSKHLNIYRKWNKYFGLYTLFLLAFCLILYWLLQIYIGFSFIPSLLISFGMALLGVILIKISDSFYFPALNFKRGITGERNVREELKKLPDEYSFYQDIKVPSMIGNIDFVVIGPTGLFTLEVKNKSGKINFEGNNLTLNKQDDQKDLRQAKKGAVSLHEFLEKKLNIKLGFNYPVLVFTGQIDIHFGLEPKDGVYIIQKSYLLKVLKEKLQECLILKTGLLLRMN